MSKNNKCVWWDARVNYNTYTKDELEELLKKYCKSWGFQGEIGESTKYEHWQIRFALIKKSYKQPIVEWSKFNYLAPTAKGNIGKYDYSIKSETKIEGTTTIGRKLPWDIEMIKELRPWQKKVVDICATRQMRTVNIVVDIIGNNGKTTLMRYLGIYELAGFIPFINEHKDLMRIVMDMRKYPAYVMDMPRAVNKERLYSLWGAIEQIKDGYAYDDRYSFKHEFFDPPVVWVFTNTEPEKKLLSADRWKFWEIYKDDLVERVL